MVQGSDGSRAPGNSTDAGRVTPHTLAALERRLGELGAVGLANALRAAGEGLLADAIERSADALRRDSGQLAAHLAGRIGGGLPPEFFTGRAGAWLKPLAASLEPPRSPLRATLTGHTEEVRAVLVAADGRTLLSSAEDGRVLCWDLPTGELLGELLGHQGTVNAMALTPGGDRLLTASDDGTIGVWNTADWLLITRLRGHTQYVRRALANAAGQVVSGSNDGTIRVWDLASGAQVRVIEGHRKAITALALLGDGTRVAAASTDNVLAVWDVTTGERVATLFDGSSGYRGEVMGLTLSRSNDSGVGHEHFPNRMWEGPDGGLYSAEDELVRWDPSTGAQVARGGEHVWPIQDVAVAPELVATASSTVRLLAPDGTPRATLYGHEGSVTAVGFSPDARTLVSGGSDHSLRVWDVEAALQAPEFPRHSGWSPEVTPAPGGWRCATHSSDGTVHLWDVATGAHVRAFQHDVALLSAVCFTPDGSRMVVTSSRGHLWSWDVASGERVTAMEKKEYWFKHLVPLRDGARVLTGAVNRELAIWDVQRGGAPELFAGSSMHVTGLELTPDERLVVVTSFAMNKAGSLQVWDFERRVKLAEHHASGNSSFDRLLLADAGRLAVAVDGGVVQVLALPEARPLHVLTAAQRGGMQVVKTTDERVLAGCVEDGRVALREFDVVRGELVRELSVALDDSDSEPSLLALSVTPDGRRASIVADGSARLVELESGRLLARFVGDAKIGSGAVRPDGAGALVGEQSGRVHVLALVGGE